MKFYFCEKCGRNFAVGESHFCGKPHHQPRISPELAAKIASEIAAAIMRSGCGTEADHLDLYKDGRYLGGWCKSAVERAMKEIIERVGNASV